MFVIRKFGVRVERPRIPGAKFLSPISLSLRLQGEYFAPVQGSPKAHYSHRECRSYPHESVPCSFRSRHKFPNQPGCEVLCRHEKGSRSKQTSCIGEDLSRYG